MKKLFFFAIIPIKYEKETAIMKNFEERLRANNLKTTHQRLAILTEIDRAGHIDIDSLFKLITKSFPTMALGTLYRNITDLKNRLILSEVKVPLKKNVYEVTKEDHIHLVCQSCGKIEDFEPIKSVVFDEIADKSGYAIKATQVSITGVCQGCR